MHVGPTGVGPAPARDQAIRAPYQPPGLSASIARGPRLKTALQVEGGGDLDLFRDRLVLLVGREAESDGRCRHYLKQPRSPAVRLYTGGVAATLPQDHTRPSRWRTNRRDARRVRVGPAAGDTSAGRQPRRCDHASGCVDRPGCGALDGGCGGGCGDRGWYWRPHGRRCSGRRVDGRRARRARGDRRGGWQGRYGHSWPHERRRRHIRGAAAAGDGDGAETPEDGAEVEDEETGAEGEMPPVVAPVSWSVSNVSASLFRVPPTVLVTPSCCLA